MRQSKGQTAMEYMMIMTISLAILAIILSQAVGLISARREEIAVTQIRIGVADLAEAATSLCYKPEDSRRTVRVFIPEQVDLTGSTLSSRSVSFFVRTENRIENITATTECTISGVLPNNTGTFNFQLKRRLNDVLVNYTTFG